MTGTRRRFWPVILLGTLSLAAGYVWGRFRQAGREAPVSPAVEGRAARVENEPEAGLEARKAAATVDITVVEIDPPSEDVESSPVKATLEDAAGLVETLANGTLAEIARLPRDRRVRAALDKLRAAGGESYVLDSLPPGVLAHLLSELLEQASLPLTRAQLAKLEELAADWETRMERQLADLGDDALALERELRVVAVADEFLEDMTALLDDRQVTLLESWTPETLEWPPLLCPLTGAPVAWRELRRDEIARFRDDLSRDLAREFGLDPEAGDHYAAKLLAHLEPLLEAPAHRNEIVERAVALGEAQARLYREILAHPATDAATHRRARARRHWLVPLFVER